MLVTDEGMVMLVNSLQSLKALPPIVVTDEGTVKGPAFPSGHFLSTVFSLSYMTPPSELNVSLSSDTLNSVSFLSPRNA